MARINAEIREGRAAQGAMNSKYDDYRFHARVAGRGRTDRRTMYFAVSPYDFSFSSSDRFDTISNPWRAQSGCVSYTETSARKAMPRRRATPTTNSTRAPAAPWCHASGSTTTSWINRHSGVEGSACRNVSSGGMLLRSQGWERLYPTTCPFCTRTKHPSPNRLNFSANTSARSCKWT